jgi:hypothetical protein
MNEIELNILKTKSKNFQYNVFPSVFKIHPSIFNFLNNSADEINEKNVNLLNDFVLSIEFNPFSIKQNFTTK